MNSFAERYVRLALAVDHHDPLYVDAYYGPPEWKENGPRPLESIQADAESVLSELEATPDAGARKAYLEKQLTALIAKVRMLQGERLAFDEESALLYDVVAPERPDSFYQEALDRLEPLLPGEGSLSERYDRYRSRFYIPTDRLEDVFKAAMDAARARTLKHISLPEGETFEVRYVQGEVWSAYNWYKGNAHSLIEVNTDLPMTIDRALGLACHEGYPGHHAYNALLEQKMVRERGWMEFTVYPLYSPQSLIAEGTAEYGVELSYPREERLKFERTTLYPMAGLDPGLADEYAEVLGCIRQLGYASNEAARRYLDGQVTRQETVEWLCTYVLSTPERAEQRIRFIEAHRSYVVTYNVGEDLVRDYVEGRASAEDARWQVFTGLLSTPQTPSNLISA